LSFPHHHCMVQLFQHHFRRMGAEHSSTYHFWPQWISHLGQGCSHPGRVLESKGSNWFKALKIESWTWFQQLQHGGAHWLNHMAFHKADPWPKQEKPKMTRMIPHNSIAVWCVVDADNNSTATCWWCVTQTCKGSSRKFTVLDTDDPNN
jgi:hypothetical protein